MNFYQRVTSPMKSTHKPTKHKYYDYIHVKPSAYKTFEMRTKMNWFRQTKG